MIMYQNSYDTFHPTMANIFTNSRTNMLRCLPQADGMIKNLQYNGTDKCQLPG